MKLAPFVKELRIVSLTELSLYTICQKLKDQPCNVVPVLGSICDDDVIVPVITGADLVINAAAHKHVPLCEQNKLEAIRNNVEGAFAVGAYTRAKQVPLIHISTDKAVNPTSTMGKTKRAAELFLLEQNHAVIVRFGNVLGSSGSVIPLWEKQVAAGGPITVTDGRCTRFFMSIDEACELVLWTAMNYDPGLYVFNMGEQKSIWEMAMIMAVRNGVEVVETGLRPGEKLTEELYTGDWEPTAHSKIRRVIEPRHTLKNPWPVFNAIDARNEEAAVIALDNFIKENNV